MRSVDAGCAAGCVDFFVCGALVGVLQVVHQGLVEHIAVLRYDADVPSQGVNGDVLYILTIDQNSAGVGVVVAEEHAEDCGLAAA